MRSSAPNCKSVAVVVVLPDRSAPRNTAILIAARTNVIGACRNESLKEGAARGRGGCAASCAAGTSAARAGPGSLGSRIQRCRPEIDRVSKDNRLTPRAAKDLGQGLTRGGTRGPLGG